MIAQTTPEREEARERRCTRVASLRWSRMLLIAGLLILSASAGWASLLGGATRGEQRYTQETAPPALEGIVQLLAEAEGHPVGDYEGLAIRDIAARTKSHFGDQVPEQLETFLNERTDSAFQRFLASYLLGYTFLVSVAIGCLFYVLIQHLTRAGWSVVTRRAAENIAGAFVILAVLGAPLVIPLLFGDHAIFEWNDVSLVQTDELLQHKRPYLNPIFFTLRFLVYFAVWSYLGRSLLIQSRQQDVDARPEHTTRMQALSAPGMILFALTTNFFAFDFLMSLSPHWFSAVYGVYYFAGSVVAGLCVLILLCAGLQRFGLAQRITVEHFHDLGKLLFGFVIFWGYIAFSQYLLIWYANIPEETGWYLRRQQGGWEFVALLLIAGHLVAPLLGLMSRRVRRNKALLVAWSIWLLAMHWVDLYWNVVPTFAAQPSPSISDFLAPLALGLVFAASVLRLSAGSPWTPQHDPRLRESIAFHNV